MSFCELENKLKNDCLMGNLFHQVHLFLNAQVDAVNTEKRGGMFVNQIRIFTENNQNQIHVGKYLRYFCESSSFLNMPNFLISVSHFFVNRE